MRTKTLLLSAAALAAGLVSSFAQSSNVYSVNVVGYYNVVTPGNGYAFLANQLTNSANNVNLMLTNGPKSDVNGVTNTKLFAWNGAGYNVFQFFTGPDADNFFLLSGSVAGWYDSVGNLANYNLGQGSGSFLFNPTGTPQTNTLVGQVVQGAYSVPVVNGFNALSLIPPVATNFDGSFGNFPGKSDPNGLVNDKYFAWNGAGYNVLQFFTGPDADTFFLGSGSVTGWYDSVGNYQSLAAAFIPKVGGAFFIQRQGATSNWVYNFTVQ